MVRDLENHRRHFPVHFLIPTAAVDLVHIEGATIGDRSCVGDGACEEVASDIADLRFVYMYDF